MPNRNTDKNTDKYTEKDTRRFYDSEDAHYRRFWDQAGSLHWGVFDKSTGKDFLKACANLNDIMARKSGVNEHSDVVDLGCGNGNTSLVLAKSTGCKIVGVDLSGVRIQNAKDKLKLEEPALRRRVRYRRASITALPFPEESFTHVLSQSSIYHVPDKAKALSEASRVLKRGGVFVFDDLIKPIPEVSETAREVVYERLMFDTDFSFESYPEGLARAGLEVIEAVDLSKHLGASYVQLAEIASKVTGEDEEHFQTLAFVYRRMVECVEAREVGWAMFVCRKPA